MSACGTSVKSAKNPSASVPLWLSRFVSVTSFKVPGVRAGVTASADVEPVTFTPVAAAPPIVTPAPAMKSVPVSVTLVPPAAGPDVGAIAPTVGTGPVAIVRIPDALVLDWPSGFVTVMVRGPVAAPTVFRSRVIDVGLVYATELTVTPPETDAWMRFVYPVPGS